MDKIEVKFEQKMLIESVIIYETYNPGSVVAIYAYDYLKIKWICIWTIFSEQINSNCEAINRPMPPKSSRKFEPKLTRSDVFSDLLRIELEHSKLEYYSELDAIEIVGLQFEAPKLKSIVSSIKKIADIFDNTIRMDMEIHLDLVPTTNSSATKKISQLFPNDKEVKRTSRSVSATDTTAAAAISKVTCSNIVNLPKEILCLILTYLDLKSIFQLRSTCKTFYDACTYDYFYNQIDLQPYWSTV